MQKPITIKDIARELKISPTTVSKALKDYPDISEKTKKKVKSLAAKLNYTPNYLAQNLRSQSSRIIGLIIPEIVHHFFSQIISGVSEYARENGYLVMVLQSFEHYQTEMSHTQWLTNFKIDGLLVSLSNETEDLSHFKQLQDQGIPVVMVDKVEPDFECSKVLIDDYTAAFQATEYLIEKGYVKIAHLGGPVLPRNAKDRLKGYRDALIKSGRNFDENLIYRTQESTLLEGYNSMMTILKSNKNLDAIFCVTDMIALGAMEAIKQYGKKIPEDIAVMGFSNWFMSSVSTPKLSTVNQPGEAIGRASAQLLIEEIENKGKIEFKKIIIPTELIIREST